MTLKFWASHNFRGNPSHSGGDLAGSSHRDTCLALCHHSNRILLGLSRACLLPPTPSSPGTWEHPFDPESTREEDFYVNETTVVRVPTMFQSSTIKHLNDQVLPCQLVQLEYMGNGTVFIILPEEGKMDTVIAALSRDTIQRWSESFTRR